MCLLYVEMNKEKSFSYMGIDFQIHGVVVILRWLFVFSCIRDKDFVLVIKLISSATILKDF